MHDPLEPVTRRVTGLFGIEPSVARAIVSEVVDALGISVDGYIVRRHDELRRAGLANEAIFDAIRDELQVMRFAAPHLSARQIRRRIYG